MYHPFFRTNIRNTKSITLTSSPQLEKLPFLRNFSEINVSFSVSIGHFFFTLSSTIGLTSFIYYFLYLFKMVSILIYIGGVVSQYESWMIGAKNIPPILNKDSSF